MVNEVGIFFIVEPGKLEYQVEIFVRSLRLNGGIAPELPIYCFQPRKSGKLAARTYQLFAQHNVVFEKINLNSSFFFYPLANKILTGSYFEKKYGLRFEQIIFFDSDFLVQGSIQPLFNQSKPIKLAPEFVSTWAIKAGEVPGKMWDLVLNRLSLSPQDFWEIRASQDHERILAYFNGGLICTHSNLKLFAKWWSSFLEVLKDPKVLQLNYKDFYFLEMATLAGTLAKAQLKENIEELPLSCNFPLELTQEDMEKATLIHYMDYFTQHTYSSLSLRHNCFSIVKEALEHRKNAPWWVRPLQIWKFQLFKLKLRLQ